MLREGAGGRRPWKVWDASRTVKWVVLAASLTELRAKGREKLNYEQSSTVRLVLESDGTHIDDDEYLRWLPDNTVFLVLRPGEHWQPANRLSSPAANDSVSSAPIPRVICDTLGLLKVRQEPPFWKIIDNRGRITLVLQWEQSSQRARASSGHRLSGACHQEKMVCDVQSHATPMADVTVVDERNGTITTIKDGKMETLINNVHAKPKITAKDRLSSQDSVASSSSSYRLAASIQVPANTQLAHGDHTAEECEFHCESLHEKGRTIRGAEGPISSSSKGIHVRFQESLPEPDRTSSISPRRGSTGSAGRESSESDLEPESNNTIEEEVDIDGGVTTEKLLLLTDQLSTDQRNHLTILDLGVILDRLKAKIIDVEKLEREREGPNCFRWTIKATIRGEVLRDLGVLYNGNYYSISEHPGLCYEGNAFDEDDEDREDQV